MTIDKNSLDGHIDKLPAALHDLATRQERPRQTARGFELRAVSHRATRWFVHTMKRIYPVVLVFALFAVLIAATIGLRFAIWATPFRD